MTKICTLKHKRELDNKKEMSAFKIQYVYSTAQLPLTLYHLAFFIDVLQSMILAENIVSIYETKNRSALSQKFANSQKLLILGLVLKITRELCLFRTLVLNF